MSELVYLNGKIIPYEEAKVGIEDRGYQFADGVYEVIEVIGQKTFAREPHLKRMEKGAKEIDLNIPGGIDHFRGEIKKYINKAYPKEAERALFYIQVTRGVKERYHPKPEDYSPNIVMTIREFEDLEDNCYKEGVRTITVPDDRWSKCYIKSIALLPNTMAKSKALNNNAFEATYIRDGFVMEGTHTNFFAIKNGIFITPPATNYILNGVTRREIFKVLNENNKVWKEQSFSKDELYEMDEAFLCGTLIDVVPIVKIDETEIGDGKPGEMTKELIELFKEHKQKNLESLNF